MHIFSLHWDFQNFNHEGKMNLFTIKSVILKSVKSVNAISTDLSLIKMFLVNKTFVIKYV